MPSIAEFYENIRLAETVFRSFIIDSNYARIGNALTWGAYGGGFDPTEPYQSEYERLVDLRQFSFILKNRALVQIYVRCEGATTQEARLGYCPHPRVVREYLKADDAEDDIGYDLSEGDLFVVASESHLRFDYDPGTQAHAASHMQYGALNDIRIPSKYVLSPFIFLDFLVNCADESAHNEIIVRNDYKAAFAVSRRLCEAINPFNDQVIHLNIA